MNRELRKAVGTFCDKMGREKRTDRGERRRGKGKSKIGKKKRVIERTENRQIGDTN